MRNFLPKNRVFIIAEAGVNHNGDLRLAKRLVDAAKASGADAIKFQTFNADLLVSSFAPKAKYQNKTTFKGESQLEMLRRLQLSESDHISLRKYCKSKNIQFISSAFDEESVEFLNKLGVSIFKIPSGEITNTPYIKRVARTKKPVILSTGMSTLKEVGESLKILKGSPIALLHCTTEYPVPFNEVNLRAINTLEKAFNISIGFSDHTLGVEAAIAAVAMGAQIIEKHMTLDGRMKGPDHQSSLEPDAFKKMVLSIRNVEKALGDGVKRPTKSEKINLPIVRKSLVAFEEIAKGQLITANHIAIKRPGTGIPPRDFKKVIGHRARVKIGKDDLITWKQLV